MLCYLVVRDVLAVVGCAREASGHGQVVWEQYTCVLRRAHSPGLELASVEKVQHCRENTLSDDMNLGERGRSSVLGRDRGRAVAVANIWPWEGVRRSPESDCLFRTTLTRLDCTCKLGSHHQHHHLLWRARLLSEVNIIGKQAASVLSMHPTVVSKPSRPQTTRTTAQQQHASAAAAASSSTRILNLVSFVLPGR